MLVRNRASHVRLQPSPYICPNCFAKAYTTRPSRGKYSVPSFYSRQGIEDRHSLRRPYVLNVDSLSTSWIRQATGSAIAASTSPLDNSFHLSSGLTFKNPEDVRTYLKKWSHDYQKSLQENAPDKVQLKRDAVLPSSLFIRNNTEDVADVEEPTGVDTSITDADDEIGGMNEAEDLVFSRPRLQPGDAIRIYHKNIRSQLAIYLGHRGVQALYFLADGRWLADCRTIFDSYIIPEFATHDEMSRLDKHLPRRTVEYVKAEDGATVPFSVLGEIPHIDSRPLLDKLAKLSNDVEAARRAYPAVNDRLYKAFADENEFKHESLDNLVRDVLRIKYDTLTEGAKMFFFEEVLNDERFASWFGKGARNNKLMLMFLPTRMYQSVLMVIQWARSYQDAAARAATGKTVSEELKENPLIPFISKARRLISKSRKIRLPTMECELGPTLESVRPPAGIVERRPTGEIFTEDEKRIIEFLWLVYVRRPGGMGSGIQRNGAIASLVVRAVGAYPKFRLDSGTGVLFLKELGCLDPWTTYADYCVNIPSPMTTLHQSARLRKEEATATAANLRLQRSDQSSSLPDTMSHLRKDWGDLAVFCVDGPKTVIMDDGISVEQSKELPDHHWVHIHISHVSAFIQPDSPLLALGPLMGAGHYHQHGSEPYIPFDAAVPFSLGANRPALTISALLDSNGSIKDIDIKPSIIRNVVHIHSDAFHKVYSWPIVRNNLSVGVREPTENIADDSVREQEQSQLIQRHRATLDMLDKILKLRWEARYREMPAHLKTLKLPNVNLKVDLSPNNVLQDGTGYERIFRSEHLVGDLSIKTTCSVADYERVSYRTQAIKENNVAGAMMIACESTAIWAAARGIPLIYRFTKSPGDSELLDLNQKGPHDAMVTPAGAEGVDMIPSITLATAGYCNITNPLRRYRDLVNHHQIDAYLRAQAEGSEAHRQHVHYPRSRQDLLQGTQEWSDGGEANKVARVRADQWLITAMYRAFYFQEAKLPEVWDVFIDNPVNVAGSKTEYATTTVGTMFAIGLRVKFQPSEEGWEKKAKFRQWVPAKLVSINPGTGIVVCEAIGPASDNPSVKDLRYPPMQAE